MFGFLAGVRCLIVLGRLVYCLPGTWLPHTIINRVCSMFRRFLTALLFTVIYVGSSLSAPQPVEKYENGLADALAAAGAGDQIPVFVALSDPYPPDDLLAAVRELPLPERRRVVIETLRGHFRGHAARVLGWLDAEQAAGNVTQRYDVWLAHGFALRLRADRVPALASLDEVARVRYEPPRPFAEVGDELQRAGGDEPAGPGELDEVSWAVTTLGADVLWDQGYTGESVLVAIIDTGVLTTHDDLENSLWVNEDEVPGNDHDDDNNGYADDINGWNFYDNDSDISDAEGHGTKCSGVVCGDGTLGTETGIAPGATFIMIRNWASGWSSEATRAAAVQYAVTNGASVISCSMSYKRTDGYVPDYVTHRYTYQYLLAAGVISTNSTGNTNTMPPPWNVAAPANCPPPWLHPDQQITGGLTGVMAIGAFDITGDLETFTGNGPCSWEEFFYPPHYQDYPYDDGNEFGLLKPDLLGPSGIPTTHYGGGYTTFSGTSASSPAVAGCMALLRDIHPQAPPAAIAEALYMTAEDGGDPGFDNDWGAGRVRVDFAHDYLDGLYDYGQLSITIAGELPGGVTVTVGAGEIVRRFPGDTDPLIERVLPGTYTVTVELDGGETRVFTGVEIAAGDTTALELDPNAPALAVSPDEVEITAYAGQSYTVPFTVANDGDAAFELRAHAEPAGGLDWVADWSFATAAQEIHALEAGADGLLLAGIGAGGQPRVWAYDLADGSSVSLNQPARFEADGAQEIAWDAAAGALLMFYDQKVFTVQYQPGAGLVIGDSLDVSALADPAGLTWGNGHVFVGENQQRRVVEFDENGAQLAEYALNSLRVVALSYRDAAYGPAAVHVLGEDLAGATLPATLSLDEGNLELHPYFREDLGFNPVALGTLGHMFRAANTLVVAGEGSSTVHGYERELPAGFVEAGASAEIEPGGGEMNITFDTSLLPEQDESAFTLVFTQTPEGGTDTSAVTMFTEYVDVNEVPETALPSRVALAEPYPNPFNASVTLSYTLPRAAQVRLAVYDVLGRRVARLETRLRPAGEHAVTWDAGGFASGVYFAVLDAGDVRATRKLLLLK
ncbi:MAG: Minor extracellular protease vpr [Calditrichaeota bacterium]|nr:Minor extracellular protease vpr [Calditrichota bacterium]